MKPRLGSVKEPKRFDFLLIGIIVMMALTSFVAIYSAFPLLPSYISGTSLILKQAMWYGIGFAAIGFLMYIGNDSIFELSKIAYKVLMVFLLLLFIDKYLITDVIPFISPVNGATSWFQFPGIGSFQPSEFMKVVLLILCAGIIQQHNEEKTEYTFESDLRLFGKLLKWLIPPVLLILIQPDTGIVIIIAISVGVMVLCSGIRKEWIYIGFTLVALALAAFFTLFFFFPSTLESIMGASYKLDRIYGWIYPEKYISSKGNQLYTALLALGSAGLQGYGLQNPAVYIPEAQTDFIFAVFGQSFGLIGSLFILFSCLVLDLKLVSIARKSKNNFEKYFICGVLGMLLFQQIQNIGMIIGLLPITGITLPLISYGGSSLLSYLLVFGIVMNVSSKAR
ncbi:MAG: FtsW/RodA/SpoVE family cell cycle protein [Erysipelotrichaceae bacterium]